MHLAHTPDYDLTYNDVFLLPRRSDATSRMAVDLTAPDASGITIPIVVANMTAVAGKRMAETVARRGGVVILPQDIPTHTLVATIRAIKESHTVYETPVVLSEDSTVIEARNLMHKRSHGAIVITHTDDSGDLIPVGLVTESDLEGVDHFLSLSKVMSTDLLCFKEGVSPAEAFLSLQEHNHHVAPVLNAAGALLGVLTQKGALRSSLYTPALDTQGRLMVGAAIGINGDPLATARRVLAAGADIIVVDTAHGHQGKMLDVLDTLRSAYLPTLLVAGNVVTATGTHDLISAGANIVKVGVGPGAMCTTRMMTGVGRPQFSAVLACAEQASSMGAHVWADGGVKWPRDVALAMAAGASAVMVGSWFAGTKESPGDVAYDTNGRMYKESFGMASTRAVLNRFSGLDPFERAKKAIFEEGISTSKMYLDPAEPGVEDLLDNIVAGLRSAMTYTGATSLVEFAELANIGVQSSSGYAEGQPRDTSW